MLHTLYLLIAAHHAIVNDDRVGVGAEEGEHVLHLNMAAESHHLVTDGMFESENDTHSDNHHGQSDGNADGSNTDGRTAYLTFVALITVYSLCYKKG